MNVLSLTEPFSGKPILYSENCRSRLLDQCFQSASTTPPFPDRFPRCNPNNSSSESYPNKPIVPLRFIVLEGSVMIAIKSATLLIRP